MTKKSERHSSSNIIVIGIDHGWSLIKTSDFIFTTGVKELTTQPAFPNHVLEFENKYYAMNDTTINYNNRDNDGFEIYQGKSLQEIANMTIGKATLTCNYSDLCSDFDAYALQKKIISNNSNNDNHVLSDVMRWYYTNGNTKRFEYIFEELECSKTLGQLRTKVNEIMTGVDENFPFIGLLSSLANNPTDEVVESCCLAFCNYVYSMI